MQQKSHVVLAGLAVAAALTVSACGNSTPAGNTAGGATTPPPTTATTTAAPSRSEAELKAALLTTADLPAGFTADPTAASGTPSETATDAAPGSSSTPSFEGGPECDPLKAIMEPNAPDSLAGAVSAAADFTDKDTGATISESLDSGPAEAAVKTEFAKLPAAFGQCHQLTMSDTDLKLSFKLEKLAAPTLGDEQFGVRMIGTAAGLPAPMTIDLMAIRHGDMVVSLMVATPPDLSSFGGPAAKPVDAQALMRTAYTRAAR